MTIERTQFLVEVEGEQKAAADVRAVGREMDAVTRKAQQADAAAQKARAGGGRLESLLQRARNSGMLKRGGVEYGWLEFNRGGFGLNKGYLRGAGGGAMMAVTLTTALAHGTASIMEEVADVREMLAAGKSASEVSRVMYLATSRKVLETVAVMRLAEQGRRLFGGRSKEQAAAEMEQFLSDTFRTREEIAAEEVAQRRARARARQFMLNAMAEEERRMEAAREAFLSKALADADDQMAKGLAGIKNDSLPVGLGRNLARQYHSMREEQIRQKASGDKAKAREAAAKLGPGEGS